MATFSNLPIELLRKIWHYTFEPRTLSVFFHEQEVPIDSSHVQVWATHFTVRAGLHVEPYPPTTLHPKSSSLTPQISYLDHDLFSSWTRIKLPPGPVALHVCAASRAIAQEQYQLYLPGSVFPPGRSNFDTVFSQSGYSAPHTWINSKLDLVFLAGMCNWHVENISPVDSEFFHWWCEVESTSFERIAVMSHSSVSETRLLSAFRNYAALKELVIFKTRCHRWTPEEALHRVETNPVSDEKLALNVVDYMTWMKQNWEEDQGLCRASWGPEIPKVKVISNLIHWTGTEAMLWANMKLGLVVQ